MKGSLRCEDMTAHRLVACQHVSCGQPDDEMACCVFALTSGFCVPIRKHWPFSRFTLTFIPLADYLSWLSPLFACLLVPFLPSAELSNDMNFHVHVRVTLFSIYSVQTKEKYN